MQLSLPLGERVDLDTDPSQRQYDLQSVFFVEKYIFWGNKKTGFSEKLKNEVFEILTKIIFHKADRSPPPGGGGCLAKNFSHKPMFHLFAFP